MKKIRTLFDALSAYLEAKGEKNLLEFANIEHLNSTFTCDMILRNWNHPLLDHKGVDGETLSDSTVTISEEGHICIDETNMGITRPMICESTLEKDEVLGAVNIHGKLEVVDDIMVKYYPEKYQKIVYFSLTGAINSIEKAVNDCLNHFLLDYKDDINEVMLKEIKETVQSLLDTRVKAISEKRNRIMNKVDKLINSEDK